MRSVNAEPAAKVNVRPPEPYRDVMQRTVHKTMTVLAVLVFAVLVFAVLVLVVAYGTVARF
jgi:hypothetical protein